MHHIISLDGIVSSQNYMYFLDAIELKRLLLCYFYDGILKVLISPSGFIGFDHVTNQIYISIHIQKWYLISKRNSVSYNHVHNRGRLWSFKCSCVLLPFVGFHFHQSILCEISCVTLYEKVNRGFNFSYYCWKHLLYSCRLDWSSCRNVRHRIKNCWQVHEQYIHVALIDINMLQKKIFIFNSWDYFYLHDKSTQWSDKSTWITDKSK